MKNKLTAFELTGGGIGSILVFSSSIFVNELHTSLFRSMVAFIAGGISGVLFHSIFKMLTYNFFFPSGSEEQHGNQKKDFSKNAKLSSSEDNTE